MQATLHHPPMSVNNIPQELVDSIIENVMAAASDSSDLWKYSLISPSLYTLFLDSVQLERRSRSGSNLDEYMVI